MEDEYKEIVRKFNEIYNPLRKRYNLRSHIHSSIYESEDDLIEIWEYSGETRGRCIVREKETEIIDCYKRAIDELKKLQTGKRGKRAWEKCSYGRLKGWGQTKRRWKECFTFSEATAYRE